MLDHSPLSLLMPAISACAVSRPGGVFVAFVRPMPAGRGLPVHSPCTQNPRPGTSRPERGTRGIPWAGPGCQPGGMGVGVAGDKEPSLRN